MNADRTTRDNFFAGLLSAACGMADAVGYAGTGIFTFLFARCLGAGDVAR